jgi:23S rRNA pseudouridine1911/1915/1917 synthase
MNEKVNQQSQSGTGQIVYHLSAEFDGLTLSSAIKKLRSEQTWGQVRKWILQRYVEVNGNLCLDEARKVKAADTIKLWSNPLPRPVDTNDIRVAYLDDHLLVVEKPAGVNSVRHNEERSLSMRRRQLQPTLDELLPPVLAKMQRLRWPPLPPNGQNKGNAPKVHYPGQGFLPIQKENRLPPELQVFAVHRLDRNTSGLMVFARNRETEQRLVSMFRRHTVQREYVAVCHGVISPQTIQSLLVRDRGDGLRGSLPADASESQIASAEKAITHILGSKPVGAGKYSLLRVRLETGRTHQIRIHLSEAGHRLCGEPLYNRGPQGQVLNDESGAPRQALHSDRLVFTHPITGQHMKMEMPWPKDLAHWIRSLTPT